MMTNNDSIIKIEHLSKAFGDKVVLDDINLSIRRGEFITLLGPSGCGKTTLLRMIAGFLKPDSGVILMEGNDISNVHHIVVRSIRSFSVMRSSHI